MITSGGAGSRALYNAFEKLLGISVAQLKSANIRMSGKTDPQIVEEIILACQSEQLAQAKLEEAISGVLDLYLQFLPGEISKTENYHLHEGVSELLDVLAQDKQISLGLLTGNVEAGARLKLDRVNLNKFFPIGAYGSDSASRLDLPAIANQRAQQFYQTDFSPTQIVIIGDAENDVLCAKHYGAISLAVSTGNYTQEELKQYGADYVFPSLKETHRILEAILADGLVKS